MELSKRGYEYPTKDDSIAKFYLLVTGARNIYDLVMLI